MSNLGRFLPLSQKQLSDESGVSGDWSPLIAECLEGIATLLARFDSERWEARSGPESRRVRDLVVELIERCETAARPTFGGILGRSLSNDHDSSADDPRVRDSAPQVGVLTERLRGAAFDLRSLPRRRRILRPGVGLLSRTIVAGYDISSASGHAIVFPPLATGAVALARATAAPTPIRAVIRGRTLVATDDGWSFGSGPELAGTAQALVMFLFERSDTVPGG